MFYFQNTFITVVVLQIVAVPTDVGFIVSEMFSSAYISVLLQLHTGARENRNATVLCFGILLLPVVAVLSSDAGADFQFRVGLAIIVAVSKSFTYLVTLVGDS